MQYKEIAYCNLSDSSSLALLRDDEGNERYAIGYQGDDILHLISDTTAVEIEDQAGGVWEYYEDCEQEYVETDEVV